MPADRHALVKEIFLAAAELPPGERTRFVSARCGDDALLIARVRELLRSDEQPPTMVLSEPLLRIDRDATAASVSNADGDLTERLPDRIGSYRIVRRIGTGGMGTVFEAEQEHPRRRVALKIIRPELASHSLTRRFEQEAELLGKLQHPGIARIYEAGRHSFAGGAAVPYFAMELVIGLPLDEYARAYRPSMSSLLDLFARICDAVHHAHVRGVVHRDLKPANIFVSFDETMVEPAEGGDSGVRATDPIPKILDFGIARIADDARRITLTATAAGQIIGTLAYMSPEQVNGSTAEVDARSDVYALGVVLYELLTGRSPYDNISSRSLPEAVRMIAEDEPTRLAYVDTRYRGDIDTIVAKALEKSRDRRYASAAALAADIRRHLHDEPISARPTSRFYQIRKFARRNRGLVTGLCAAACTLLVGSIVSIIFAVSANQNRLRAEAREVESRRAAYRASIAAAAAALRSDDFDVAELSLSAAPIEHRGWEWHHYHHVLNRSERTITLASPPSNIAFDARLNQMFVTSATSTMIESWDLQSGARLDELPVPQANGGVAASCDGTRIAWTDGEANLMLFDVQSGEPLWALTGGWSITQGAFSLDDREILVGSTTSPEVVVLNASDGRILRRIDSGISRPASASWIADVDRVFCKASGADYSVADAQGGPPYSVHASWAVGHSRWFRYLQFAEPDDNGSTFTLLDICRGEHIARIPLSSTEISSVLLRPRDSILAALDARGTMLQIDRSASEVSVRWPAHAGGGHVTYSDDGETLVSISGQQVRVWSGFVTPTPLRIAAPRFDPGYGATLSRDGGLLLRGGWGCVSLWDVRGAVPLWRAFPARSYFLTAAFDPSGKRVAVAGNGDRVFVLRTSDGSIADEFRVPPTGLIFGVTWLPGGTSLALASDTGELLHFDMSSRTPRVIGRHGSPITAIALSSDGTLLATGSGNGLPGGDVGTRSLPTVDHSIRLWDCSSWSEAGRLNGHDAAVKSLDFRHDNRQLVSGCIDGTIVVWDITRARECSRVTERARAIVDVSFSCDGTRVVSTTNDTVRIRDASSGELVASLTDERDNSFLFARFTPNDRTLVTATHSAALLLYETSDDAVDKRGRELAFRASQLYFEATAASPGRATVLRRIAEADLGRESIRVAAARIAQTLGPHGNSCASTAFGLAAQSSQNPDGYRLGQLLLGDARSVYPDEWRFDLTGGLLHYRLGEYREALLALEAVMSQYAAHNIEPPLVARLAIALTKLRIDPSYDATSVLLDARARHRSTDQPADALAEQFMADLYSLMDAQTRDRRMAPQ